MTLAQAYADRLVGDGIVRGLLGPREAARIWERHLLNSAALAPFLDQGVEVVDLGSGAGLPGIPLWLARPDLSVTLVEPLARRANFLRETVALLGLPIEVVQCRAEDVPPASADAVVARALAPMERLIPMAVPALRPGGSLLALKGQSAGAEVARAEDCLRSFAAEGLVMSMFGDVTDASAIVRVVRAAQAGRGRTGVATA